MYDTSSGFGDYAYCNPGGVVDGSGDYKCSCEAHTYTIEDGCAEKPGSEIDRFSGGTWYSWPAEVECTGDQQIGDDSCKWKLIGEPSSVNIKKLKDSGYKVLTQSLYNSWSKDERSDNMTEFINKYKDKNIQIIKNNLS